MTPRDYTAKKAAAVIEKNSGAVVVFASYTSVQECDAAVKRLRQFGLNASTRLIRKWQDAIPGAAFRGRQ